MRRTWIVVAVVAVVVVVGGIAAAVVLRGGGEDPTAKARAAVTAYADGWRNGDVSAVAFADGPDATAVGARLTDIAAGLGVPDGRPSAVEVGAVTIDPQDSGRATGRMTVSWPLGTGSPWTYETDVAAVRGPDGWAVDWSPSAVHPDLDGPAVLRAERLRPDRGTVLGAGGEPLVQPRPVVEVGIVTPKPGAAGPTPDQLSATTARVAAVVEVEPAQLQARVAGAGPDQWVSVVTLRREKYDEVRPQIYDLPGTAFRTGTRLLAPTRDFARALLGSVGDATAEDVDRSDGRIEAGDQVGHGGLEGALESTLAGTPGVKVRAVLPDGTLPADLPPGPWPRVVYEVAAVPGTDVATSLDSRIQLAADAALVGAPGPAALVAVWPSTGDVLAVANAGGTGGGSFDRALEGRYPPGSTFKVVTTYALLAGGMNPDEVVACPPSINVGGRAFVNAESGALGAVPFRVDVAQSCNTAFVSLNGRVDDAALTSAGAALGLRDDYGFPVTSFGGDVPPEPDAVGHAAAMIGQGKVLASPLGMATVAASVANGSTVTPVLVRPGPTGGPAGSGTTVAAPGSAAPALDQAIAAQVGELMRGVVTGGTSTILAGVPGAPVHAKSGTAEFGSGDPPPTHAWMIGYQGDIAFAVLVEGGGFGARTAGPIAQTFLRSLA